MESTNMLSWDQKMLISELIHGMDAAKQLQLHIGTSPSSSHALAPTGAEANEVLVQQVVSSYEKALSMLNRSCEPPSVHQMQPAVMNPGGIPESPAVMNPGGIPESPASINGSPRSEEFVEGGAKESNLQDYNFNPKKRKMLPRWKEHVRISPERGLEGPQDDGFSWRKYGQKDILGATFPRSYYRCTYRNTQNCWATKQVQRSDGDPTVFEVTYRGRHTCSQVIPPPPASPEKQDTKTNDTGIYQNDLLDNLRSNLTVRTDGLDGGGGGDAFSFPTTPLYDRDFGGGGFCNVGYSDPSDFQGLISANTSTGSSPIFDVDFQFDPTVDIDTGFTAFLHENTYLF